MKIRSLKVWRRAGGSACLAAAAINSAAAVDEPMAEAGIQPPLQLAQGGEGGEAGVVPGSYALMSTDPATYAFDVRAQVRTYADLVLNSYEEALAAALRMQNAIGALLDAPSSETLEKARQAWVAARPAYLVTEVFRFYDGPIDQTLAGEPGPESRINAWPLNEAHIDAVVGRPKSGLVWDQSVPISRKSIMARDQVSDESDVTTGWHAIEFLLWGQDLDPDGPGQRPHTDYLPGSVDRDRRRTYLDAVTALLVDDLRALVGAWDGAQDNYRERFLAMPPREALGRAINGAANLVGHELAAERLAVALDSGDQEDEHSCFSDTTHQDHLYDLRGALNVWRGALGEQEAPHSLRSLVLRIDPALAARTDALFDQALAAVALMDKPFDSILRSDPGSPARARAEDAISAFQALSAQLARVGQRLGVLVIVPGLDPQAG